MEQLEQRHGALRVGRPAVPIRPSVVLRVDVVVEVIRGCSVRGSGEKETRTSVNYRGLQMSNTSAATPKKTHHRDTMEVIQMIDVI